MNENLRRFLAEFEQMEKTIDFQKKIIMAATAQKPTCPCCKVPENGQICAIPELPKLKLNDCSWDEIAMYANSGMADKVFALGDTKNFTLSDDTVMSARIIGFNHDKNRENKVLPITFETVETLNDDFQMNPEYTNKGGWQNSQLRKILNNSIIEMLPADLRKIIKPCMKETSLGGNSEKFGFTSDPLFVLSEQEIFGRKIYSHGGEGRWYDWYRLENTEYGKCKQNGERDWRWERSPYSGNTGYFCFVSSSGGADTGNAYYDCGVSFGFCV